MSQALRFRNHETRKIRGKALWVAALLWVLLLIAGCSGVAPFEPRNNREEGPEKGLFTGTRGEWVILGPKTRDEEKTDAATDSGAGREEMKQPEKPANAD